MRPAAKRSPGLGIQELTNPLNTSRIRQAGIDEFSASFGPHGQTLPELRMSERIDMLVATDI
jgi:hypothetical protein